MAVAAAGARVALEDLYRAHAPLVARWAARIGGPSIDVEDVVHDVFLIAGKKLAGFRGDAALTTWLYRITARVVRARRRSAWFRRILSLGETPEMASTAPSPLDRLERRRDEERLYRLLDRLGEKYRTVIILHEIEQLSAPEIAELTGVPPKTIWVQLHRARAKLRALIEEEER